LWGRRRAAQNVIISLAKGDIRGALNTIWEQIKHEWDELWKPRNISNIPILSDALRWIGSNDIGNAILYYGFGISVHKDGRVETSIGDTLLNLLMFVGVAGAVAKVYRSGKLAVTATKTATVISKTGTNDRVGIKLIKTGAPESRIGLLAKIEEKCKEIFHIIPHKKHAGWIPHIHILPENLRRKYWTGAFVNKIFFGEPGKVGGLLRKWGILRDRFLSDHWVNRLAQKGLPRIPLNAIRSLIGGPFKYVGNLIAHPLNPFFGRTVYRIINSSNRNLRDVTYPVNLRDARNFSRKLSFAFNNNINVVRNSVLRNKNSGSISIPNRISLNVAKVSNTFYLRISKSCSSNTSGIINKGSINITAKKVCSTIGTTISRIGKTITTHFSTSMKIFRR
jgi:hypothetical protein